MSFCRDIVNAILSTFLFEAQTIGKQFWFICPGEKSVKEIQRTVKEADVQLLLLDLNSLDSVRKFAANLHSTVDKVCNPLSGCTIGCDDFNILY
jgi:hypothetical protein